MAKSIDSRESESPDTDTVLEIRNARVTYDMSRGRARVVDDVSFDIQRGETFAIVGESGSGKSSLGAVMVDAVEDPGITSGEVRYYPEEGAEPINILELNKRQTRRVRYDGPLTSPLAPLSRNTDTALHPARG